VRHSVLLLLAIAIAACGDDHGGPASRGPQPASVDLMRVVKISGDQAAQVPPPAGAQASGPTAVVGADGWTNVPLIARIEIVQPQAAGASFSVAADSMYVPPGTLVHWRIEPDCGELFASTTATDDSAHTANRWRPGTRAGTCTVEAGRLVGTDIVIDTTWTLEVLPGPIYVVSLTDRISDHELFVGDTVDLKRAVIGARDAYDNAIPIDSVYAWPDSLIGWAWSGGNERPSAPSGHGWITIVPYPDSTYVSHDGIEYFARLWLWLPAQYPQPNQAYINTKIYRRSY